MFIFIEYKFYLERYSDFLINNIVYLLRKKAENIF